MQPSLVITNANGETKRSPLGEITRLGRAANSDVLIAEPSVSRRHAVIRRQAKDEYILTDLGSANGTRVNDEPIRLPVRLRDGDRIGVGSVELCFQGSDQARGDAHVGDTLFTTTDSTIDTDAADRAGPIRLIGTGASMMEVLEQIQRAATTPIPVLVTGETGTGKELVSRAIHDASPRAHAPFVAINCSALPENLLESELFGHRRGSFTGAIRDRPGLFEAASGGTVFLDEVGELPPATQPKLLRFLQEGEIRAVGDTHARHVDVRVISATNRDLTAEVAQGTFREDLFYRLTAFTIELPPLRARSEDIPLLAERLLRASAQYQGKRVRGIDPAALEALRRYEWPGNVRELENELARAVAMAGEGDRIGLAHLSARITGAAAARPREASRPHASEAASEPQRSEELKEATLEFERRHIAEVLDKHGGNVSRAAQALGLSRGGLHKKLKELGLR